LSVITKVTNDKNSIHFISLLQDLCNGAVEQDSQSINQSINQNIYIAPCVVSDSAVQYLLFCLAITTILQLNALDYVVVICSHCCCCCCC